MRQCERPLGGGKVQYSTAPHGRRLLATPLRTLAARRQNSCCADPGATCAWGCAQPAQLAFAPVDMGRSWKCPALPSALENPQRAAAQLHRLRQHLANGAMQAPRAATLCCWRASSAGCRPGTAPPTYRYCPPDDQPARQQQLLDGHAAGTQPGMKGGEVKVFAQGAPPQAREQLARMRMLFARGPDHRAKAARVMQPQGAAIGLHVEMVVRPRCGRPLRAKRRLPDMPRWISNSPSCRSSSR